MLFKEADRLKLIPPYLFAEIDRIIDDKKSKGEDVISLGIGDPDIPTPDLIISELNKQSRNPDNHRYPSSYGLKFFKRAVSDYYKRRFKVEVDPESEVLTLWGSKEGIANIAYAFINPGDYALVPDPGYLVYKIGTLFAGGKYYEMPLVEDKKFIIDLSMIDKDIAKKSRIIHINYPNNPTSAMCGSDFFEEVTDFALENDIIVCHDNAYCDVYFDENEKPSSFLNADKAKDAGIEFNSLSKTFNMTGWRIAFAVGNRNIIQSLGKYKTNVDSGVFNAIQYAAGTALDNYERLVNKNLEVYKKRREIVYKTFDRIGIRYYRSNATIYIWANVPGSYNSRSFSELLLNEANVVVTPGSAFGGNGEGFIRLSITLPDDRLEEAMERIQKVI